MVERRDILTLKKWKFVCLGFVMFVMSCAPSGFNIDEHHLAKVLESYGASLCNSSSKSGYITNASDYRPAKPETVASLKVDSFQTGFVSNAGSLDFGSSGMFLTMADEGEPAQDSPPSLPSGEEAHFSTKPHNKGHSLAQKSQNPISDMISLPFQNNFNFRAGPGKDFQNVLNIQPVIPVHLNEDLNMITRAIIPIIHQPEMEPCIPPMVPIIIQPVMEPGLGSKDGMGDIQFSAFFSPAKSKKFIWGVGPVLRFPTGTTEALRTRKWSAGPTGVVLVIDGPWVAGALVQNVWSYAGESRHGHVSEFLFEPFVNYNLCDGWYLASSPIITANWAADRSSDRWTIPVGGGIGKIIKIGKQPLNVSLRTYHNIVRPRNGPTWTLQLTVALLF